MNTGARGRIGVHELLRMTPAVQSAVERGATAVAIRRIAVREGMVPMWRDGFDKARLGLTPLEEVLRVAASALEEDRDDGAGAEGEPMRLSA